MPSARCGVPTQMKCTSPNSAASRVVGGEAQPAGGQVAAQQLVQPGLVDRHLAGGQLGDLRRVDVDAEHLVAELGEADRVRRAEVAGAEEGQPGSLRAGRTATGGRLGLRRGTPASGIREGHACLRSIANRAG